MKNSRILFSALLLSSNITFASDYQDETPHSPVSPHLTKTISFKTKVLIASAVVGSALIAFWRYRHKKTNSGQNQDLPPTAGDLPGPHQRIIPTTENLVGFNEDLVQVHLEEEENNAQPPQIIDQGPTTQPEESLGNQNEIQNQDKQEGEHPEDVQIPEEHKEPVAIPRKCG